MWESNPRIPEPQSGVLTTSPIAPNVCQIYHIIFKISRFIYNFLIICCIINVGCDFMKQFFVGLWEAIVKYYMIYNDFIHSIFKDQLGDLVVGLIDITVAVLIVLSIGRFAFTAKEGTN